MAVIKYVKIAIAIIGIAHGIATDGSCMNSECNTASAALGSNMIQKDKAHTPFLPSDPSSWRSAVDVIDATFPARTADGVALNLSLLQGVEVLASVASSERNAFFVQLSSRLTLPHQLAESEYGGVGIPAQILANNGPGLMEVGNAEGRCGGGRSDADNADTNTPQTSVSLQPGSREPPASCTVLLCKGRYRVPNKYPWMLWDSCSCMTPEQYTGGGMHALVQIPKKIIFAHVDSALQDEDVVVAIDQIAQLARQQTDDTLVLVDEHVLNGAQSQLTSSDLKSLRQITHHEVVIVRVC